MYPKDSSSSLSRAFNSWHSPLAMGGEATVEETSVNVGGQSRLLRREYALFTDNADTFKFDESNPLECGHNRAKTQEVINVAGLLYCDECAHRCPRCGHWVVCDEGQEIHNIWYHHDCGRLERLFADIKLLADAQMEIRKVDAAILRNDHAQAQIENIYANIAHMQRDDDRRDQAQESQFENDELRRELDERRATLEENKFKLELLKVMQDLPRWIRSKIKKLLR